MEWIKCSEKLPENDDDVLVFFPSDGITVGFFDQSNVSGYVESDGSYFKTNDGWEDNFSWARTSSPTHWMPLPPDPKDE